jgi:hypothetical protein
VLFVQLLEWDSSVVKQWSNVIGMIDVYLYKTLKLKGKKMEEVFQNKEQDAIAACYLQGAQLLNDT